MKINEVIVEGFWDSLKKAEPDPFPNRDPAEYEQEVERRRRVAGQAHPVAGKTSYATPGTSNPQVTFARPAKVLAGTTKYATQGTTNPQLHPGSTVPRVTAAPVELPSSPVPFKYGDPIIVGKGQKQLKPGETAYETLAKQLLALPSAPNPKVSSSQVSTPRELRGAPQKVRT